MYWDNCMIEVVNESSKFGFLPEQFKTHKKKQNLVRQYHQTTSDNTHYYYHIVSTSCPQHCVYSSYIFNNDVMLNRFNNILDNLPAVVLA